MPTQAKGFREVAGRAVPPSVRCPPMPRRLWSLPTGDPKGQRTPARGKRHGERHRKCARGLWVSQQTDALSSFLAQLYNRPEGECLPSLGPT